MILHSKLVKLLKPVVLPRILLYLAVQCGFYGRQNSNPIDETFESPHDEFSHQLCKDWENAALLAQSEQTRVCLLRTGIVLAKKGGALGKMLPAFKLCLGGPIGNGEQGMSWIHIDDMIQLILFIIRAP